MRVWLGKKATFYKNESRSSIPRNFCSVTPKENELQHTLNDEWNSLKLTDEHNVLSSCVSCFSLKSPTVIQVKIGVENDLMKRRAIPFLWGQRKTHGIIAAETGSGKTLAYLLPIIHKLKEEELVHKVNVRVQRPRALILVPNRELCDQVTTVIKTLSSAGAKVSSMAANPGGEMKLQKKRLEQTLDILVSTPGRVLQLKDAGSVFLSDVKHLVVDEADSMLEKDFKETLKKIILPIQNRKQDLPTYLHATQVTLCSATLKQVTKDHIKDVFTEFEFQILTAPNLHKNNETLKQNFLSVGRDKMETLLSLLRNPQHIHKKTMVFCNSIACCNAVEHTLRENGFKSLNFHRDVPILQRKEQWKKWKEDPSFILVCTDIASRGLDTVFVEHVINFDFPPNPTDYLHRIGRTARAGRPGTASSLIAKKDEILAAAIKKASKLRIPMDHLTNDRSTYEADGPLANFIDWKKTLRDRKIFNVDEK